MGRLRARVIVVVVCLSLIAAVSAFVGCSRSPEQVEEVAAPVAVVEGQPVDAAPAAAEAEEAPEGAQKPAEAASAPASEPEAEAAKPKKIEKHEEPANTPAKPPKQPAPPADNPPALEPAATEPHFLPPAASREDKPKEQPVAETPAQPAEAADEEKPRGMVVVGKIALVSNVPEPSSVPYDTCVTFIKYRVDSVESGQYEGKELLAVFWGMRDGKLQPAARFTVGQRHRLTIELFSERGELARVMQADDTNEYSLTPYWVTRHSGA